MMDDDEAEDQGARSDKIGGVFLIALLVCMIVNTATLIAIAASLKTLANAGDSGRFCPGSAR